MNEGGVCIRGGSSGREAWFEVSCCPPNVARTLASLSSYVATTDADGVQIHQYMAGRIRAELAAGILILDTSRPTTIGRIKVAVLESPDTPVTISLRVPAWATGAALTVGESAKVAAPGTATITQAFQPGQEIILDLRGPPVLLPDDRTDAVRGCVAIERGPEVLALESGTSPKGGSWTKQESMLRPVLPRRTELSPSLWWVCTDILPPVTGPSFLTLRVTPQGYS
ncbi:beta-L-arabinofuranosidase domain-containing protein [Arthrobacter nitrophenolicus]|uniref:beta-L-arabinofuranosidase domain-containing protein n=1 Tax=Arthrobacter nitrophenolicus TaxID=683150 RepID=UPI0014049077|nr:beta-L-arabinofuranosidase domain-containing protein [Arthrobacter nitrophenolicus]